MWEFECDVWCEVWCGVVVIALVLVGVSEETVESVLEGV